MRGNKSQAWGRGWMATVFNTAVCIDPRALTFPHYILQRFLPD